jgi:hypothetical protein
LGSAPPPSAVLGHLDKLAGAVLGGAILNASTASPVPPLSAVPGSAPPISAVLGTELPIKDACAAAPALLHAAAAAEEGNNAPAAAAAAAAAARDASFRAFGAFPIAPR